MAEGHHPRVFRLGDGRWQIQCPECFRAARTSPLPIGIGVPIESEVVARMMQENHAGRGRGRAAV
jgi:hypothetical protein